MTGGATKRMRRSEEGNSQKPISKKIKSENLDSVVDKLHKVNINKLV
jgi:hypothetical protein